jgi:hypothetical protein
MVIDRSCRIARPLRDVGFEKGSDCTEMALVAYKECNSAVIVASFANISLT